MARFGRSYPIKSAVIIKTKVGRNYAQIFSESMTTTESIIKNITRIIVESTLTASETLAKIFVRLLDLTESIINVTDQAIQKNITRIFTDSSTINDILSNILGHNVNLSDSSTITDINISISKAKTFIESVAVSEYFKMFLNGLTTLWSRTIRTTGSWVEKAKSTVALWSRIGKQ